MTTLSVRPPDAAPPTSTSSVLVSPAAGAPLSAQLAHALWTEDLPREHGFEPFTVEGRVPAELRGTLFRNGPGLFGQFGKRYGHPFEADGAVSAFRIDDGGASAAVRVTASRGLREERAAGKMLFGESAPWHRRIRNRLRGRDKNTANTSVMFWQGRLLALMEAGRPTEIDPDDLRTIGETDLDGAIVSWFSAHPHRVASRRTTYNFGQEVGRVTRLHTYALPDVGPAAHLGSVALDGPTMLHDFIATERHLIFFVSPIRISIPRVLLAIGGFADLVQWRPELGVEVICVPIDRPDQPVRFTTDAFFQWHFTNAYERGPGEIVIDYVRYPDFSSFHSLATDDDSGLAAGRYHRAVLDLDRRRVSSTALLDAPCEFPKVDPRLEGRAHRHAWISFSDLGGIGCLDTETGAVVSHRVPAHQRVSEPVFVPRSEASGETDGHVLVLCYDGARDRSFLAIYDGRAVADGPVARLWMDHRVPITFHGTWAPAAPPEATPSIV